MLLCSDVCWRHGCPQWWQGGGGGGGLQVLVFERDDYSAMKSYLLQPIKIAVMPVPGRAKRPADIQDFKWTINSELMSIAQETTYKQVGKEDHVQSYGAWSSWIYWPWSWDSSSVIANICITDTCLWPSGYPSWERISSYSIFWVFQILQPTQFIYLQVLYQ